MKKQKKYLSRRETPWDKKEGSELTPMQKFLREKYHEHYDERHPVLSESGEVELINTFVPTQCPYCKSSEFKKYGYTKSKVQRYKCKCGKTFLPTTGTIFDSHKISISEWIEYCLNLFRYLSITADSWNNKNAFTTSKYWLEKVFLLLEDYQNDIVLSGTVWLDETYFRVRSDDIQTHDDGKELRGLSVNQICIGVAYDKTNIICFVEGLGKPSQKKSWNTFKDHIAKGSTIIHDKESTHRKLINELNLKSVGYSSKDLKGIDDKDNPLNPVNQVHRMLKLFLYSHKSFNRNALQNYLNLFAFVFNKPKNHMEKIEVLLNLAFSNPKLLRFRDTFNVKSNLDSSE